MKFNYKARTKEGELQVGNIEAASRSAAATMLGGHDLFVLSIEEAEKKHWYDFFLGFLNKVKVKDLMIFTRQFATLLSAKIPISDSLNTLRQQTRNPILKDTVSDIQSDIDAGLSLSQSLEKYGDIFSVFYVNMVRSAELTGRVEESVNFLADYLEKETAIISKIRNALIYPAIMLVLFLIVAAFMAAVVLPKIEPVFIEAGVELPLFTKILIGGGKFLASWWWVVLLITAAFIALLVDYLRTPEGKNTFDEIILRTPVFGGILKQVYVARFAESVSVLVKGGISMPQAMEVTGHTIGSTIYREMLHQTAEDLRKGELLSQSLSKNEKYFPPLLIQMTAIGESTGRLEELLDRVSRFYSREVDSLLDNLVELIQPVLMVFIGLSVGALFASILIPIFQLAQRF
ncbi:MAG TPA: type II secretion system F family protein [Candidatus Paceibacterota bacterium]